MKTQTSEQIEKMIGRTTNKSWKNILRAKLSQHQEDIKNFENFIDDLKYNSNDLLTYKKRLKEALKFI